MNTTTLFHGLSPPVNQPLKVDQTEQRLEVHLVCTPFHLPMVPTLSPALLPLDTEIDRSGNVAKQARLDVSGIGVWGSYERTFLDVRIVHPNAPSYADKSMDKIFEKHEKEKKRDYNERVIQVEKGLFTPIVMSTFGGMGVKAKKFH